MVMTQVVLNLRDVDFNADARPELQKLHRQVHTWCDESVRHWRNADLFRRNDSLSFAVVVKVVADINTDLADLTDDPRALFDFSYTEGEDSQRYAANALRKMRATARTSTDTATLCKFGNDAFENVVDGSTDTPRNLPWGEFPYGGARLTTRDNVRVLVGVSGFTEQQDDWLADAVGGFCALKLTEHDEAAAAESSRE